MFDGTTFDDVGKDGGIVKCNLNTEWADIQSYFESTLLDIADITNDRQKTNLEGWFEVLKKVMKMWESQALPANSV